MKQPKLKIGDKYRVIKTNKIITVEEIFNRHSFYGSDNNWHNLELGELQLIKPKTKKVKKWKYSRKEGLERLGFLFNMKGEYNAPNEVNGEDVYKIFMATQSQPIKEEGMTVEEFIDTSKKIREDLKQQSKDIEPFKTVFTYSKNYPDLCATQTPEFREWVKQVTDTLNSLTKRNIK